LLAMRGGGEVISGSWECGRSDAKGLEALVCADRQLAGTVWVWHREAGGRRDGSCSRHGRAVTVWGSGAGDVEEAAWTLEDGSERKHGSWKSMWWHTSGSIWHESR
jgi:hypothetical protein